MLWATAAGKSGKGAWAFQFHPETSTFSLVRTLFARVVLPFSLIVGRSQQAQFWKKPRDEGITQADLNPVSPSQHRVFIMAEGPPAQILQVLITFNTTSLVGETETERVRLSLVSFLANCSCLHLQSFLSGGFFADVDD